MGYNCGMPVLKLDNCAHPTEKSRKNSGNARAVIKECLETTLADGSKIRYCKDDDYDSSLTKKNLYWNNGYRDATELCDYWDELASKHKVKGKDGKEKKLRSDAGIGFTGIVKPEEDFIKTLNAEQQRKFFLDALQVLKQMYADNGMVMDFFVIQYDEGNVHAHYGGHDPDYQLGKKLGLPFKTALNSTFPALMRERGWQLNDLSRYKQGKGKSDMPHGLDSKSYKYWKDTQKKENQLENEKALFEGYKAQEMEKLKRMENSSEIVAETSENASRMPRSDRRVGYAPWE